MSQNGHVGVLLVDDTPGNLTALEALLDDLGLEFLRATSGEESLRVLDAGDVALVLLDVRMPGMSGFDTARHIRSRERTRHTPIIFLTADFDDRAAVTAAYELGAVDYLVKPLIPVVVRAKVAALVELFRLREQSRREAEQLRQSEERFRLMVESVKDYAIFRLEPDGTVATWNAGAERLKGYRADEIIGRHFSAFYSAEAVARGWPDHELTAAAADGRFEDEGWRVRKDGTTFWANVVITALCGEGGRLVGFAKVTRDLTERRNREEALKAFNDELERRVADRTAELRESEGRLHLLANGIPNLAWMARPDGHVFWFNSRWHEYTGMAPDETQGWGWQAAVEPDTLPAVLDGWKRSLATGEPFDMAIRLRSAGGDFRPFLTRVVPQRDDAGGVVRWFGTNTDISQQKAAEDALRERDRQKDEFMAMLAHELRNPLAPIQNALQLLQLNRDDATVETVRQMVGRQVGQLTHLVDDLLEAARVTTKKVTLRKELFDLAQLARVVTQDASSLFGEAGVAVAVDVPDTPLWASADWTRLTQVVGNLLTNAAKFTPRGGRVTVSARAENGTVAVRVSDTGEGIAAGLLGKIFIPFTQGEQGLARVKGGLGLGLSLVKGLTELHGGTVVAESGGVGRGATFTVRLPRADEPQAVDGGRPAQQQPGRGLRVLIVEDNVDAAESLRMVLELGGCEVHVAHTGPDGVAAAKRVRPNLVICDIGLPGFSGYEVARRIRAEANGSTVLVALTGYGRDEDREAARAAGFNLHFTKPVDFRELERVLGGVG